MLACRVSCCVLCGAWREGHALVVSASVLTEMIGSDKQLKWLDEEGSENAPRVWDSARSVVILSRLFR